MLYINITSAELMHDKNLMPKLKRNFTPRKGVNFGNNEFFVTSTHIGKILFFFYGKLMDLKF